MNSKDSKYLVSDAKPLTKSVLQSSNSNKYPSNSVSKTVSTFNSTKDARQAYFASSASSTSSTSKYKESTQKSSTQNGFSSSSKVTTSSWTTSATAAAESKSFLKSTSPESKYAPQIKYNSYSSINRDVPQTPTNSIFYSFDKSIQKPFGSDIQSSKYISPYRGQTQQNPYAVKSSSEIAKWSEQKTNPALYKKPTANVNVIQKPLGSLLLTTAASASISKNGLDPQSNITNGRTVPSAPPLSTTAASTRR